MITQDLVCVVNAWSSELDFVLAHTTAKNKSNEITAIHELLEMLTIQGCIVSVDAMGCQRSIAEEIVVKGGEYVLAAECGIKETISEAHEELSNFFRRLSLIEV